MPGGGDHRGHLTAPDPHIGEPDAAEHPGQPGRARAHIRGVPGLGAAGALAGAAINLDLVTEEAREAAAARFEPFSAAPLER
jgi:hypothetical protein